MKIKQSAIITKTRLRRNTDATGTSKGEDRRQRTRDRRERTGVESSPRRRERRRETRQRELAGKSEKLVACLRELDHDRGGKGEKRPWLRRRRCRRERERERECDGDRDGEKHGERGGKRSVGERRTERIRLILPPHAIPHTRVPLVLSLSPTPHDVDSHECTNTSRDLKPPCLSPCILASRSDIRSSATANRLRTPVRRSCLLFSRILSLFPLGLAALSRTTRCGGHA